jgi:hypothetical protein
LGIFEDLMVYDVAFVLSDTTKAEALNGGLEQPKIGHCAGFGEPHYDETGTTYFVAARVPLCDESLDAINSW